MTDDNPDLPPHLSELLRSVPPADVPVREAHLSAALGAMDAPGVAPSRVIHVDFRRRVLAAAAAIVLLGLAWGAGRAGRGDGGQPTAADQSEDGRTTEQLSKGFVPQAGSPACTHGTIQMIDSVYIGDYVNPSDEHTYLVFTFGGSLEFVNKDTCTMVQLTTVTTTP